MLFSGLHMFIIHSTQYMFGRREGEHSIALSEATLSGCSCGRASSAWAVSPQRWLTRMEPYHVALASVVVHEIVGGGALGSVSMCASVYARLAKMRRARCSPLPAT